MPYARPVLRILSRMGTLRRGLGIGSAAFAVALAAGVLLSALPAPGPRADEELRYFRIGTGTTGAMYFNIGALIANAISNPPGSRECDRGGTCGVPGLIAVAQTTQGSVENIEAVGSGLLESGLSQADVAYWAFNGEKMFEEQGALDDLRAIANLYQEGLHVVVAAESEIEAITDLEGKRVALGEPESGSVVTARLVLEAYGLGKNSIEAAYLPLGQAIDELRDGSLDAVMMVGGSPLPAFADLAETMSIRLIPVDGEPAQQLRRQYPFFTVDVIPAHVYRDVPSTVTLGVGALWVVSAELDPELVYGLTRALWHKSTRRLLDEGSPLGRLIRVETALNAIPIPLHPGAARYYNEVAEAPPSVSQ